ncbi:Peptide chain release factor 3 (RF-3), partial [Streptococcus agalactiae 18RS21]
FLILSWSLLPEPHGHKTTEGNVIDPLG